MTAEVIAPAKPRRTRKTGNPQTDRAAAPVTAAVTLLAPAAETSEPAPKPLSTNARKRIVAEAVIAAAAELAATWEHDEISREEAAALISAWMNYIPGGVWDDRLGERSGAGKRTAAQN